MVGRNGTAAAAEAEVQEGASKRVPKRTCSSNTGHSLDLVWKHKTRQRDAACRILK